MAAAHNVLIRTVPLHDALVLTIPGGDYRNGADRIALVRQLCEAALTVTGCRHAVLDVSQVQLFGSEFLGALIALYRGQRERRAGDVTLAGVSEMMGEIVRVTRLDKLLKLIGTVEDALAALPGT
jgi:anti-anti-sigma factor